ncbi:MAG: putative rRNA maturation factor [Patescibacteria group bacterium]|nr:putative rRNA maturation factor [Patescibacteria group bacterium]
MPQSNLTNHHVEDRFVFATELPSGVTQPFLIDVISNTLSEIDWTPAGKVSVAFVDEHKSKSINREFSGNDYPTDVLSFDYSDDAHKVTHSVEQEYSGEILICTTIAIKQAEQYGVDVKSEIALLLIHGILHLSGLDHQNSSQKTSFERQQSVILKSLNLKHHPMPW